MANKRIRELDTMTIGSGGTAASSVFLAVDPNSGTTSKVSLEDAVAGTAALSSAAGGGSVGIPSIANQGNMRTSRNGTPVTVANLFAVNTTTFGSFSFAEANAFRNYGGQMVNSLTLSKSKGTNSLLITTNGQVQGGGNNKTLAIGSGNPREGGAYYTVATSQKGTQIKLQVSFWANGFYVRSSSNISYQLMYWPQ